MATIPKDPVTNAPRTRAKTQKIPEPVEEQYGNPDMFQVLSRSSSGRSKQATRAMSVPGGVVVRVTMTHINPDDSISISEALTYVPGVTIKADKHGGKSLA